MTHLLFLHDYHYLLLPTFPKSKGKQFFLELISRIKFTLEPMHRKRYLAYVCTNSVFVTVPK